MRAAKITITIEPDLLLQLDRWVREGKYPNRSRAIQAAVVEKLERVRRRRLTEELANVNAAEERELGEEAHAAGSETWYPY